MLFYHIGGELTDKKQVKKFNDFSYNRKEYKKIKEKIVQFNHNSKDFYFLINYDTKELSIDFGAIVENGDFVELNALKLSSLLGLDTFIRYAEEITFEGFMLYVEEADYQYSTDNIMFGKYGLYGFRYNSIIHTFNETIINVNSYNEIEKMANKLPVRDTLIPELDRIKAGKANIKASGHPVHYTIETDDYTMAQKTYEILFKQLYKYGRVISKRISVINPSSKNYRGNIGFNDIYLVNTGSVTVIDFNKREFIENDIANADRYNIEKICEAIKIYSDRVLTIMLFPKECTKLKEIVYEQLGTLSFVEIKEELVASAEAKKILKNKAKEKHVRADKKLTNYIDDNNTYLLRSLNEYFEEWYKGKLKTSVYPQYKDINTLKKSDAESKHKGRAYEELEEMVGLAEAKNVINQALDFYKARKLYESKGIMQKVPSMHMIFTGNPGTAKTSVARLFAEIMKDNKVLTTGNLVEVGRGDLVGKYVGWTAPLVKQKFQEAKGGVLFIDEAYSLVDDRDGLYGDEAINTIVQEMENHRNELVVIFAGYPDKMEAFLQKNPGLRSRIAFHVPFKDYDVDELCSIAEIIAKQKGLYLADSAMECLRENFEVAIQNQDFGNGRYVRNVIEKAVLAQASRLIKSDYENISSKEVSTIYGEDIEPPVEVKCERVKMGFCS